MFLRAKSFSNKSTFREFRRLKATSQHDNSYQYWQVSKIPTMHFQRSLPRLPIPKLEKTCERYLAAQRPLLIDEAFRKTKANVIQFRDTTGKFLQDILVKEDKKNKHTSYISELWFDMYLKDRIPLPINYNPMIVMQNDSRKEYNDQLLRATNMLISSLRFCKSLRDGVLDPEVYHLNPKKSDTESFRTLCSLTPAVLSWYVAYLHNAYPLDMSQYPSLFGTSRIPEMGKDRLVRNPDSKHVLIQRGGHFYTFDVFDNNGNVLPPNLIYTRLKYILSKQNAPNEHPVGVLTTLERDRWASIRHNLSALGNEKELKLIDSALFSISFDDEAVGLEPIPVTRKFLHGDGRNRWFDKSISLQFAKDGVAGVNFEHSWGDGVAVLRYVQDIFADSTESPQIHPGSKTVEDPVENVQHLDIKLDDKIREQISDAYRDYEATCESLDVRAVVIPGLGKKDCKKNRVSPDAVMQMAFQAAYFKQTGKFVPTYESCSTAAFKHGRTETVRPCTAATKAYSLAVNSPNRPSKEELLKLISQCSKAHSQLTKEAAMGQGFDRHLFALRKVAERNSVACNIFDDPEYKNMNHNVLSTSTLASPAVYAGGFGPVVKDGLGIAYVIHEEELGVLVTSYPPWNNGSDFITCVQKSFQEIRNVLQTA